MSDLVIQLDNCFGIKHLEHTFSYDNDKNVHLIYAPNGCMKTSFAKTMRYVSKQSKNTPCDMLHEKDAAYKGLVSVTIDGRSITSEHLFVADGEEDVDASKSFANFLASSVLKSRYEAIYNSLIIQKDAVIRQLNNVSRSSDCEKEILATFKQNDNDTIFSVLERLAEEITVPKPSFDFRYNDIFDKSEKVKGFVEKNRDKLKTYFDQFQLLIGNSKIFRSHDGHTFGTFQASQLEKSVSDGDFFGVEHKIVLYGCAEPVSSAEDLSEILTKEKTTILSDEKLRGIFDSITSFTSVR